MKTDKELALRVVDALEEYYLRCTLLETILEEADVPGWRQCFEEVFPLSRAKESARRQFQPVRERILDAPDLSTAVRDLLKNLEGESPTQNDPEATAD